MIRGRRRGRGETREQRGDDREEGHGEKRRAQKMLQAGKGSHLEQEADDFIGFCWGPAGEGKVQVAHV